MALSEKLRDHQVITAHPERAMSVCTKLPGNSFYSCRGISLRTTEVNLPVTGDEKSADPQILSQSSLSVPFNPFVTLNHPLFHLYFTRKRAKI